MTGTAYERLLDRLERVRRNGDRRAMARCPVPTHEDSTASLSLRKIEGRVLVFCHGGCSIEAVLDALAWTKADLFDDPKGAAYRYGDGRVVHRSPDKRFHQTGNTKGRELYRLAKVVEARDQGETVFLVEGEQDVHTLESIGVVATTAAMGAGNFDKVDASPLHGVDVIAIVDNDERGEKVWAPQVLAKLDGKAKSLSFAKAKVGKDISDHIAAELELEEIEYWSPPEPAPAGAAESNGQKIGRLTVSTFTGVQPRTSTWLLDGVLPDDDLTVFIGEEGIGKGLFAADVIGRITRAGHNVLIIATEDDLERVVRPRLDVADADTDRCFLMVTADPDMLQEQPNFPHNRLEVETVIREHDIRLVYIDPWVSSVSGGLKLQNTQDARRAIDPLVSMARTGHCSVLAVAHPNRGEGDIRAKVGLTAVLRQAARLLLYAIEPPDDDTRLIVGIEKANETARTPATVYRKLPRKHSTLPKPVWAVEEVTDAPQLTIRQWHDRYRTDRRTTDRWPQVLAVADHGMVDRADIVAAYVDSGSDEAAADKAINRWVKAGRLVKKDRGVYELG